MANKVKDTIVAEVQKAGYFSFSVDSTPDISHTDQLTLRYVSPEDRLPTERFLTFLELKDHSGESIADLVFNYITTELEINFRKCRGHSYDNAANMAGRYNGMKQKIIEKNKFAKFVPCAGHSLNLVDHSVDYCLDAVNFFGVVNEVYIFFSSSTKRWAVLKSHLKPHSKVPKYLSDNRWKVHAKATEAILENYNDITDALNYLHSDNNTKSDTRLRANNLLGKMEEFEFMFMLHFWNRIHRHFSRVNKILQSPNISLSGCADWHRSLFDILREQQAKNMLPNTEYRTARRIIRSKRQRNYENSSDPDALDELSSRDKFRIKSFIPILDALESNLGRRASVYDNVVKIFSFLADLTLLKVEL
ncbi:protein FAM200B-like [Lycorma delicatula]|uniref:protein FAM200B-like n=1 Tax=Lycorma delicatula TaxID=130591 RepID=UPI003F516B02